FVEDEAVPVTLVATLWRATAKLDTIATGALCARLADLGLLTLSRTAGGGSIGIHDVLRDLLHDELGRARVIHLHCVLLDAVAAGLPAAPSVPWAGGGAEVVAWWELPNSSGYLWDHLVDHLIAADRGADAETLTTDLRWVQAR